MNKVKKLSESLRAGVVYKIQPGQPFLDKVHPCLTAAPFTVQCVEEETFKICGFVGDFPLSQLDNISLWGESDKEMTFKAGHKYQFVEELIPYFYSRFNTGNVVIDQRHRMTAQAIVDFLGGTNGSFVVSKVSENGNVFSVEDKEGDAPLGLMYILEADDRRYFQDITESDSVVNPLEETPDQESVSLEDKINALFSLPDSEYEIRSCRGRFGRVKSAADFIEWLNEELASGLDQMENAKRHYEESLDRVTKIGDIVRKVV